ncbi:MAG: hypothetical protein ACREXS_09835 [Gammaproteobacteria bacterium]
MYLYNSAGYPAEKRSRQDSSGLNTSSLLGLGRARTRVRHFTCSDADIASVSAESVVGRAVNGDELRAALEDAVGRALTAIRAAADALRRSRRTKAVRDLFCEVFGVLPEFVPSWRPAGKTWDRGDVVRARFQFVAKLLDGRFIRYFCWGSAAHCPECTGQPETYFACSSFGKRYVICLGAGFWKAFRDGDQATMASTLLHEALHIYFGTLIAHGGGRFDNANCYERFVVLFNGLFLHPATDAACARFTERCK